MSDRNIDLGPILVSGVGLEMRIDYTDGPARVVKIEEVYGHCLDHPTYIRGYDSRSGEVRTFRTDRITRLHGRESQENISWFIGQLLKLHLGRDDLNRPPQVFCCKRPVIVDVIHVDGTHQQFAGIVADAEFHYRYGGACLRIRISGAPSDGSGRRRVFTVTAGPSAYGRQFSEIYDGETGAVVEDVLDWLEGAPT